MTSLFIDYKTKLLDCVKKYDLKYKFETFKDGLRSAEKLWICKLTIYYDKFDDSQECSYEAAANRENHSIQLACKEALTKIHRMSNAIYRVYLECKKNGITIVIEKTKSTQLSISAGLTYEVADHFGLNDDLLAIQKASTKILKKLRSTACNSDELKFSDNPIETLNELTRILAKKIEYKCLLSIDDENDPFYLVMYKFENLVAYDCGESELKAKEKAANRFLNISDFYFKCQYKLKECEQQLERQNQVIREQMKKLDKLKSNHQSINNYLEDFYSTDRKRKFDGSETMEVDAKRQF